LAEFATDFFVGLFDCIRPARKCKTFSTVFVDIFLFSSTKRERRTETAADAPSEPPPRRAAARRPLIIFLIFKLGRGGANRRAKFSGIAPSFSAKSPRPAFSDAYPKKKTIQK